MMNANSRGDRFIEKVVPLAKSTNNKISGTPNNTIRIKALLKTLRGMENNVAPETVTNDEIQSAYSGLKSSARRLHQNFVEQHPQLKNASWDELGNLNPTIKSSLMLDLEKKAFDTGVNIHLCKDMWAADRLLFEAFRGCKRSKRRSNKEKPATTTDSDPSTTTNNPTFNDRQPTTSSDSRKQTRKYKKTNVRSQQQVGEDDSDSSLVSSSSLDSSSDENQGMSFSDQDDSVDVADGDISEDGAFK